MSENINISNKFQFIKPQLLCSYLPITVLRTAFPGRRIRTGGFLAMQCLSGGIIADK